MTLNQFAIINLGALVSAAGGIFLKKLSDHLNHNSPIYELIIDALKNSNLWLGGACYVFPIILWTYLLKYMELTKLQPLLSIVYIYTILMSIIFLNEIPSIPRIFGIILIIFGVIFVSKG